MIGLAWALLAAPAPGAAQAVCEEDAGGMCEDDGGVDAPGADGGSDAGAAPDGGSAIDGGSDAGGPPGVACSCHTDSEAERGQRIHVCTESFEEDVCAVFSCERGTVRSRGCPGSGATLCCAMKARGLQTYLYEDCTHANCESGFREQCREFGGTVSEGACESQGGSGGLGGGDDDGDGGACAVHAPGASGPGRAGASNAALLAALALLGARLRRRPRAPRAARSAPPRPA